MTFYKAQNLERKQSIFKHSFQLAPTFNSGDYDYWSCKLCFRVQTWLDVAGATRRGRGGNRVIPVISGF